MLPVVINLKRGQYIMRKFADTALNLSLVCAALVIAAMVVRREFLPNAAASSVAERQPSKVPSWPELVRSSTISGSSDAKVVLLSFMDLQCPFCKEFHQNAKAIQQKFGRGKVALAFVHLPIAGHKFAKIGARGAECAGQQGRFESFISRVYEQQDSIGIKPWLAYAADAGIADSAAFNSCMMSASADAKIVAGMRSASQLHVTGTPTIVIDGWELPGVPNMSDLDSIVTEFELGHRPDSNTRQSFLKAVFGRSK